MLPQGRKQPAASADEGRRRPELPGGQAEPAPCPGLVLLNIDPGVAASCARCKASTSPARQL